jgi:site-specific recombinase XerD
VFHSKEGNAKPYCSDTARRIFDRAGLSDCSFHTLRHTLASRLIQNGLNIYEVKEILGHTDIKTTMRYAHLERTDISLKAKQVLDQLNLTTSDTGIDTT